MRDLKQNRADIFDDELTEYSKEFDEMASRQLQGKLVEETEAALIAIPIDIIPVNVALPCTVYIKFKHKILLFRRQGEKLTSKRAMELEAKGVGALYIHKAFWRLFLDSLENLELPKPITPEVRAVHMRHLLVAYGQELERKIKEPKKPLFDKLRKMADNLAISIKEDPVMGSRLLRRSTDSLLYFVNHSVNVAIYSTLIANKLRFSAEDQKLVFYAGLVHDVGDLFIPKRVLYKPARLTPDEMDLIKSHARRGAELLLSFGTPGPVIQTALQHHERVDGAGYPSNTRREEINPFAKIVAISDVYDALTNNRPYERGMTPHEAILKMRTLEGKFDPQILETMTSRR